MTRTAESIADTNIDKVFRLAVPTTCAGVPAEMLLPRNTWHDKSAYDASARQLAQMFAENHAQYAQTPMPIIPPVSTSPVAHQPGAIS